jgi:hypothetical protein
MRKLSRYHLKPLQIGRVAAQQANQIESSLQPSSASHAAEEHTRGVKPFEFGIYCLLQNPIDWQLSEIYRSLGCDPPRESALLFPFMVKPS